MTIRHHNNAMLQEDICSGKQRGMHVWNNNSVQRNGYYEAKGYSHRVFITTSARHAFMFTIIFSIASVAVLNHLIDATSITYQNDGKNGIPIPTGRLLKNSMITANSYTPRGNSLPYYKKSNDTKYTILPKRIYSVIGLESSGTQFVTNIIQNALNLPVYREGSKSYDNSQRYGPRMEQEDIQVQHFSLPFGGGCAGGEYTNGDLVNPILSMYNHTTTAPIVDVVLPSQCTRTQNKFARAVEECHDMIKEIWGVHTRKEGKPFRYPSRYQLDIVSHKEWYDSHGVEQFFVIVIRDEDISSLARNSHCRNETYKIEEDRVGTDIIIDAINRYILHDDSKRKVTRDNYKYWVAGYHNTVEQYLNETVSIMPIGGGRRKLLEEFGGVLPMYDNQVLLVSYESLMKLGQTYVKMLYKALGIKSKYVPNIKNGNSKYVNYEGNLTRHVNETNSTTPVLSKSQTSTKIT